MSDNQELRAELLRLYEEVMWLAKRPGVSPSAARAWYTHVRAEALRRRLRQFTGKVSRKAADSSSALRLEHYKRIQTTLTSLVQRHTSLPEPNANEFINVLIEYERVHIVTFEENYAAMKAKGDYGEAGIELLDWEEVPIERRTVLWATMLNGKVANAVDYREPIANVVR